MKQIGKHFDIKNYMYLLSENVVQVPYMTTAEQVLYYRQGLETRIKIDVERPELASLHKEMTTADGMENLFSRNCSTVVPVLETRILEEVSRINQRQFK